ncbi:hypothetical protein INS49_014191 [Diaporthe citri]|uniref:uncharacterized protein n=1 Tax=Diaporthe citri TaxID=83186 RepID=UPI001C7F9FEB|nr:uncharacterized protein INS49_014191 [Diaporthe citri]KAG6358307.1 hypothetical protein INS49_014191 [Diaporthe citri]
MSQASGQVSGDTPLGESGPSQTLTSYVSASPTITERISNNLPDKNRKKRLETKITSLDAIIRGKGSGSN